MHNMMAERAARMKLLLTDAQIDRFEVYHRMLTEANAQFNLTRVSDELAEAIDRNYLDCAAPVLFMPQGIGTAIDVGSGAGFPGIPLAICMPDTHFVLMDSLAKRVDFLQSVIEALHLNAEAVHARAEDAARRAQFRDQFDLACARAVAPMNVLCEYLLPFVRAGGRMMALKGPGAEAELAEAERALSELNGSFERMDAVSVPGRDWDHRILWIRKHGETPEKYPRRAGKAEKKPL